MDYVLLTPDEAGALLNISRDEIVSLVETGELGGLRIAGHWRIPLKSITALLAAGMRSQTARSLERVFNDPGAWTRVFGAHPEVTQQIEAGQFPTGSVGAYLKESLALWRGRVGHGEFAEGQDDEYGPARPGDDGEAAAG
jgi:excisionase family DNA binding protein